MFLFVIKNKKMFFRFYFFKKGSSKWILMVFKLVIWYKLFRKLKIVLWLKKIFRWFKLILLVL